MPKLRFYFVTPPEMPETDIIWLIKQAEALFHKQIEEYFRIPLRGVLIIEIMYLKKIYLSAKWMFLDKIAC